MLSALHIGLALLPGCRWAPTDSTSFTEISDSLGLPSEMPAWDALAQDLDNDGHLELVVASHSHAFWWEIRDGAIQPDELSPWLVQDVGDRHGLAACDLTGDGRPEVVVNTGGAGGAGGRSAEVWTQTEQGWQDIGASFLPGTASVRGRGATCTDVTGDGRMEVHLSAEAGPDHLATPGRERPASLHVFENGSNRAHWVDLNGDQVPDLARVVDERLEIQLQLADGTLAFPTQPSSVRRVGGLVLDDLDSDGDVDLYVGSTAGPGPGDLVGPGRVRFRFREPDTDTVSFHLPADCQQISLNVRGRLDGDRARFSTSTDQSRGTLTLSRKNLSPPDASLPLSVWIIDETLWIRATASTGQAAIGLRCQNGQPLPVAKADIDLTPVRHSLTDEILWNNGDGTFSVDTAAVGDSSTWDTVDAAAHDYDQDGDLDLFVVLGRRPGTLEPAPDLLLENLGDGRFSPSPAFLDTQPTGTAGIARWVQLTEDERADLLQLPSEYGGPLGAAPRAWKAPMDPAVR